jgi:CheY-like chemotaxis protein/HPt (histidine-containing phosphotransfer) domain-containing protein
MDPVCTTSALEGIALLKAAVNSKTPFDLVITDEQMPGMDGSAMARAIRATPAIAETLIVMLTSVDPHARGSGAEALISAKITKPVLAEELRRALLRVIRKAEADPGSTVASTTSVEVAVATEVHVLVAEDNLVNQEVARELIEQLGYVVDIVGNGREALDAIAAKSYSIVLMDCQMPEMDGYEAATELRRREASRGGAHLPVVAVTAQAMTGDRERVIAAGMDDYLSKPLNPDNLEAMLRKWVKAPAPVPPTSLRAPERSLSDVRRSPRIASIYLEQLPLALAELRACFDASSRDGLRAAAHKLKGSSLSIGAPLLVNLCLELEGTACEHGADVLGRLEREAEAVRIALGEELRNNNPNAAGIA